MLSQDPFLLRHLGERQRYLPPVLAWSGYLAITSAAQVSHSTTEHNYSQTASDVYRLCSSWEVPHHCISQVSCTGNCLPSQHGTLYASTACAVVLLTRRVGCCHLVPACNKHNKLAACGQRRNASLLMP